MLTVNTRSVVASSFVCSGCDPSQEGKFIWFQCLLCSNSRENQVRQMGDGLKLKYLGSFKTRTKETYKSICVHSWSYKEKEDFSPFTSTCKFAILFLPSLDKETFQCNADKTRPHRTQISPSASDAELFQTPAIPGVPPETELPWGARDWNSLHLEVKENSHTCKEELNLEANS